MPSRHLILRFPCKYLGTFLNTIHPHFWGLWQQCVLSEAAERWGLRQGHSCLAASPALTPRKGWARPSGSPRSCAPPGLHPGLPSLSQLVEKPLPGDMGSMGGAACKPNLGVRLHCVTLGRPLVSSDAQIPPFLAGVVVRAKVDNTVQM